MAKEMTPAEREQIRQLRRKEKQYRVALLRRLDELEKQLCQRCIDSMGRNGTRAGYKCSCPASVGMREIGVQLGWSMQTYERRHRKVDNLTPEIYVELKSDGYTDNEICKLIGWGSTKLYAYKSKHRLTGKFYVRDRSREVMT